MAADEAMLESAGQGVASLRFYTWAAPTLTLGYFQESGVHEPNLAALPWVRRSTGGGAIVHHHELTYSFAFPNDAAWKSAEPWICRVHRLLRGVLLERGVTSRLVVCGEEQKLAKVLCFQHQTPGDLLMNGSKVAGSAQRKLRGALLQHGSLLLRRSEFAPELPGIYDVACRDLFASGELADLLAMAFAHDIGASLAPGPWTSTELARIPEIMAEKYANPEWNTRR